MNPDFEAIYLEAHAAGMASGAAVGVRPMVVGDADLAGKFVPGGRRWVTSDGPCGFAWVTVPSNSGFGKYLKKTGKGRSVEAKGVSVWVSEFNQSHARKVAYADAFADVLSKHGIAARSDERMD